MDKVLKELYDSFYAPPAMAELTAAVEAKRTLLRERLAAEDRKVVLRIVDDLGLMALERSYDSFICGFKLAWRLANELNNYKEGHSTSTVAVGLDGLSASMEREKTL